VRYFRIPVLRQVAAGYVELARNTPLLVQLFFLYAGLPRVGIRLSAEACAVIGLTFLGGAYMAETFRSGIEAVDTIQMESALSLGMTRRQAMFHIILPQAVTYSVPAFVANLIFLLKETSVFSCISILELMFTAKDRIAVSSTTVESLFLVVVFYLIVLLPVSIIGSVVERRLRYASFGN
jgi:polar amino acid transport system permease protein